MNNRVQYLTAMGEIHFIDNFRSTIFTISYATFSRCSRKIVTAFFKSTCYMLFKISERCGGQTNIVAAFEHPAIIKKILTHLGLPYPAPEAWPSRGPPDIGGSFTDQRHFTD